jgi:hypothetical protein
MGERNRAKIANTVRYKVDEISKKKNISLTDASIELYDQYLLGEISLIDPNPPKTLINYLFSLYSAWFWLIFFSLVLMILTIYTLPQVPPFSWLRVALGFITSLYLPGYTFIEALYPQKEELEELERFGLSVGLSIALTPLTGFLLNYTPWGIRLNPIMAAITMLTILLGLMAIVRKHQYHMLTLELRDQHG